MKIEIPEHTIEELKYIYGNDEQSWLEFIERAVEEFVQIIEQDRAHGRDPEAIVACDHKWLKIDKENTYRCVACDKEFKFEDEIPF